MKIGVIIALLISSSIIIASPSIVRNGSFEEWENGRPLNWLLGQGVYKKSSLEKIDGQYSIKVKPDRLQKSKWIHSKISQIITLKPQHRYKFSCYLCKNSNGTHEINLIPLDAGNKSELQPIFTIRAWTWPIPYTCIEEEFTASNTTQYRLEIIQYATTKLYNFIDNIKIIPVSKQENPKFETNIFLTQTAMRKISPQNCHKYATVLKQLSLTLTRNETESTVIIFQTGDIKYPATNVVVKGNLTNSNGTVIPIENITIRDFNERTLPISIPRDIGKHQLAAWQVSVRSEEYIIPGQYRGTLLVQSNGKTIKSIPLIVDIVDILLPKADITFGVYHSLGYFPAQYINKNYLRKIFNDMKSHGMNSVTIYNNPETSSNGPPDFQHNQQYDSTLIPTKYTEWSKILDPGELFTSSAYSNRFNIGLATEINLGLNTGLLSKKHPVLWLVTKRGHYSWGGIQPEALKKTLTYWTSQKNWPEPLLYILDEPSGMPAREKLAKFYFKRINNAGIKVKTVTANLNPDEMGNLYDIWILGSQKINYHNFKKATLINRQFWMYNCSIPNNNASYFRAMYGFSAIASKVTGVWAWAYYDANIQFISDKNGKLKDNSATHLSKVGLSPSGPVPTIAWEAIREGTEDYRLTQYFLKLYKTARKDYRSRFTAISKLLSNREINLLRIIDKQKYTKPKVGKTVSWTPPTPDKKKAAVEFIKIVNLEQNLNLAYRAKTSLIDAIPISLAPAERMPTDNWQANYKPDLGEHDPATAAEEKRLALIPVILKLQQAVSDNNSITTNTKNHKNKSHDVKISTNKVEIKHDDILKNRLLFYVSFDKTVAADLARGDAKAYNTGIEQFTLSHDRIAKWGTALNATKTKQIEGLAYQTKDNIDFTKGTIEFFARIDDFGKDWQKHCFVNIGKIRDKNISMSIHPQKHYLIFSWNFFKSKGWFHVKKIIKAKNWYHYAMIWELDKTSGKGHVSIYIDGKRYSNVTNIKSFPVDNLPTQLYLAGKPGKTKKSINYLIGYIDDFAIFNDVLYTKNFTPRTIPLSKILN